MVFELLIISKLWG